MRSALSLSAADRRWIDFLTQTIYETWDDAHPGQPKTHGYLGSEEFIRLQFEEYLLALLSSTKYHNEFATRDAPGSPKPSTAKSPAMQTQAMDIEGDPALDFNLEFLERWRQTPNYALFDQLTSDALLFSIVEPRHPCAGGLGFEDIQRRLTQQVADLHLDDRVREGREALNKHFTTGQKKVATAFNSFWSDIDAMRKRNEEKSKSQQASVELDEISEKEAGDNTSKNGATAASSTPASPRPSISSNRSAVASNPNSWSAALASRKPPAVDLTHAQASVAAAGQRASAYFSSWGSWATERRKEWQQGKQGSQNNSAVQSPAATPRGSISTNINSSTNTNTSADTNNTSVKNNDAGESADENFAPPMPSRTNSDGLTLLGRSDSARKKRLSGVLKRSDTHNGGGTE